MRITNHARAWAAVAAAMLVLPAAAGSRGADATAGTLVITAPWSRPTPPGTTVGVVYLSIDNRGAAADRLIGLDAAIADSVEIHETSRGEGVMQMRRVAALECPPQHTVELEPGGAHLMLVGLRAPLTAGMNFPLVLHFATAGAVTVHVRVRERE